MKNYEKPVVTVNDGMSEGVYAASGDCFETSAYITQTPTTGFGYYVVHVDAVHSTTDHHSTEQVLTITFSDAVTYGYCSDSSASYVSGNGTTTLQIQYSYHANCSESIGLGDLYITSSAASLSVTSASLSCNYTCSQHDSLGNY